MVKMVMVLIRIVLEMMVARLVMTVMMLEMGIERW